MGILEDFGPVDQNGVVWRKAKTSRGKDFEVGNKLSDIVAAVEALKKRKKQPQPQLQQQQANAGAEGISNGLETEAEVEPEADWVGVYWPVGDDSWKQVSQAVRDIGISRYRLYFNGHPNAYSYTLYFTNTKGWSFDFKDDSNDVYTVSTIINGDHYVKYNSDAPNINAVK
ncbi:hypothetical protein MN608_04049 [Microdochium nivale]|nr:hypothetical protein MN608_04049 [Microdochium nivale]